MAITYVDVRRLARHPLGGGQMRARINLLGVGGVGSNIIRQTLRPPFKRRLMIRAYDPDTIEIHNLNRTSLFKLSQVGVTKVRAATETARPEVPNLLQATAIMVDSHTPLMMGLTIDARDTLDPTKMPPRTWLKLAYNGGSLIGFTWRPDLVARYVIDLEGGRSSAYEVVPSFYVPAALLAVLALNFARYLNFLEITEQRAGTCTMDIDEVVQTVSYTWTPRERTVL